MTSKRLHEAKAWQEWIDRQLAHRRDKTSKRVRWDKHIDSDTAASLAKMYARTLKKEAKLINEDPFIKTFIYMVVGAMLMWLVLVITW